LPGAQAALPESGAKRRKIRQLSRAFLVRFTPFAGKAVCAPGDSANNLNKLSALR